MNNWNIPDWLEKEVKERDKVCVYCRVEFESSKESWKTMATWEHIVNDARIISPENIVRCCFSCNASGKGGRCFRVNLQIFVDFRMAFRISRTNHCRGGHTKKTRHLRCRIPHPPHCYLAKQTARPRYLPSSHSGSQLPLPNPLSLSNPAG